MVQNYWFLYDYLKENEFRHFGNLKRQNDSFSPYGSGSGLGNLEISIFSCATWPILQVDKCQRQAREFYSTTATDLVGCAHTVLASSFETNAKTMSRATRCGGVNFGRKARFTRDGVYERAFIGNVIV